MLCSRVQNLLSAYCDRELTGAEMLQIRSHLGFCPACQREHAAIVQVKSLLGALSAADPQTPFRSEMLDAAPEPAIARLARAAGLLPASPEDRAHPLVRLREAFTPGALSTSVRRWCGTVVPQGQAFAAVGGAVAVSLLAVSLVQKPQPADAVDAHVGGSIAMAQVVPAAPPEPVLELTEFSGRSAPSVVRPAGYFPAGDAFGQRVYSGYAVPVSARPTYRSFVQPTFATFEGPSR
jgi:anti-sigma factor RsiW